MGLDLLSVIDSWAVRAPERPAHVSGGRVLTYAELIRRSDAMAARVAIRLGSNPAPVAVLGHKEPEMLVGFLGAVKSGHAYIPIDTSIPQQRVDKILQTSGTGLLLTPDIIAEWLSQPSAAAAFEPVRPEEAFYIIFTSGSTGEPKGVVITLSNLTSFVEWMLAEQRLAEAGETFLNQAPFSFDLSVMDLYLSLATGGTLFSITAAEIANLRQLYSALARSGVTSWVSTPSFAQLCLAEKTFAEAMLPALRRFLFCGETLQPETAAMLLDRFPAAHVWNTYGPTEATCATTSLDVDRSILSRYSPLPVGYVKPGTRILIVDDAGQPVRPGENGEMVIAGPNVSHGYLHRPDLNARSFFRVDNQQAYRTGDRGHYEGELLFFEGRIDNQIKLHGYRIELGDVEANLRALPGIRDVVVVPVLKEDRAESLMAFVILKESSDLSDFQLTIALREQAKDQLPAYMIPARFYRIERIPMTPNGKADRRALAETLA